MISTTPVRRWILLAAFGSMLLAGAGQKQVCAQDDLAGIPSRELTIGDDRKKAYFLIGAKEDAAGKEETGAPAKGYGLVIIMPGGDGSADFHPFVKRIYKNALPEGYLAVQPVAPQWSADQQIVWPTEKSKVDGQTFSTEQFVTEIIADVKKRHAINPARIFTLTWSSSGPAAYAMSLNKGVGVTGSFVAMSVFKPDQLGALTAAKDHAYFIYHSPDDKMCPMRMAEDARDKLKAAGAKVEFKTYPGGHGWKGNVYGDIRKGLEWLEKNASPPAESDEKTKSSEGT